MDMDHVTKQTSNDGSLGLTLDSTISLSETSAVARGSFDYSTSSSETIHRENTSDLTSRGMKKALEEMQRERDLAFDEAQEAREILSSVIEAVQILTKQIKSPTEHGSVPTIPPVPSDLSVCDDASTENGADHNRKRTFSGLSATTIASYTTNDNQRFSDIVNNCSNHPYLSKSGADLIALEDACRAIEQNAQWSSQESSTVLEDLHQAHAELNDLDHRCHNAEKCAKQLYKENKALKNQLEKYKAERKFLVKEIKKMMDEKKRRESFQRELLDSLKAHEDILIEGATTSKQSGEDSNSQAPRSGKEECKTGVKETQKQAETPSYSSFNPIGKLLASLSGTSDKELDTSSKDEESNINTPATPPKTHVKTNRNPPMSLTLATMLESPDFNDYGDDNESNTALQLTPSISTNDSLKSVLSAQDLDPEDKPTTEEAGLKPVSSFSFWTQRQVNTAPSILTSAPSTKPKQSVVTVKLSKKKVNNKPGIPLPLPSKTVKTIKYRHYTIS